VGASVPVRGSWRPVRPSATALIDQGANDPAIVCGGFAAALRRAAANFACRPRVHTLQSLTTRHQAPAHHHDDAPTQDHRRPKTTDDPTPTNSTNVQTCTPTPPHREPSPPRPKPMTNARTRGRHTCRFRKREPDGSDPGSDPNTFSRPTSPKQNRPRSDPRSPRDTPDCPLQQLVARLATTRARKAASLKLRGDAVVCSRGGSMIRGGCCPTRSMKMAMTRWLEMKQGISCSSTLS
jgi:hypothetical protein